MKKSVKRIACAVLSLMMASTLAAEYGLKLAKDSAVANAATTATTIDSDVKLKNVTGQFDTSKIVEENFNDSVLRAEDVAPKYETRTVMVTLSGKPLADLADNEKVSDYVHCKRTDRIFACAFQKGYSIHVGKTVRHGNQRGCN